MTTCASVITKDKSELAPDGGQSGASGLAIELAGAYGFTAVVASQPAPDAAAWVELDGE